ncbi:MAG: hypothetical protein ACTH4T_04415 [Staphylococcus xylosus]|uniref:hypothetical protein n=1 Tax=Staphylococcus xylosus TaxID=1288 RepID=UPI000853914D|nr:hypothetical protein [Staphylococcus xylosus]
MKLFVKIFIAGLIGELCIFLIIYMGKFDFLKQYEKIDVTVGVMGLFTTFLGAYLGAKIAGNESRKLFKQEIKMNDLNKNMSINLDVLEKLEYVKTKIDYIKDLLKNNQFLTPDVIQKIQTNSNYIYEDLNELKDKYLSYTSVILYSDIQNFHRIFCDFNHEIKRIIDIDETRKLIKSVENSDVPEQWIKLWEYNCMDSKNYIHFMYHNDKGEEIKEKISVDLIAKKNKEFFKDKKEIVEKHFDNANHSFNIMKYKKRDDLIREYTELYKD